MAQAEVIEPEEGVAPLQEETSLRVYYSVRCHQEDESESVTHPLIQQKHQDRAADTHTATDGADRETSAPQELPLASRDEPGCSGSVSDPCNTGSVSSLYECPICSELFGPCGDHRVTLLNCNHAVCHLCIAAIMTRAKDQSRLLCPFCRQTTPFPQWEIRRLQEESYSNGVYQPLVLSPSPEVSEAQSGPASPLRSLAVDTHVNARGCCACSSCFVRGMRMMRRVFLCISISIILLLLGCFLYALSHNFSVKTNL